MGPFTYSNGYFVPLIIKMTKFIVGASKGEFNYDATNQDAQNRIHGLTLDSFNLYCDLPILGVYLITIGV